MSHEQFPVKLSHDEIGLLLHWMYRAQASGPAASVVIRKLQDARKELRNNPANPESDPESPESPEE